MPETHTDAALRDAHEMTDAGASNEWIADQIAKAARLLATEPTVQPEYRRGLVVAYADVLAARAADVMEKEATTPSC